MATEFIASSTARYTFTLYSSTLSAFQTAYQADIPELASVEALATTAAPTVAIIVTPNSGPVLSVPPGSWLGYNFGNWAVLPASSMGRAVADAATTSTSTTVTSASAAFGAGDVGAHIATPNLPPNTTIVSVTNSTTVVASAAATATGTSQALTISPLSCLYTPDTI